MKKLTTWIGFRRIAEQCGNCNSQRKVKQTTQGPICSRCWLEASECTAVGCKELGPYKGFCREHQQQYKLDWHHNPRPLVSSVMGGFEQW